MNIELLDRALAYIDEHPEEWDQSTWDCGTAACIAGHMVRLSGESLLVTAPKTIILRMTGLSYLHPMFDEGNTRATLQVWRDALAGERIEAPGADLSYARFEHVDMRGANLHDAVLTDVDLTGADLRDADLEDATLDRVNFTGADLRGAYLADSELRDVDFSGAKRGPQ